MKTTQRRPSSRALALAFAIWLSVVVAEVGALVFGSPSGAEPGLFGFDPKSLAAAATLTLGIVALVDLTALARRSPPHVRRVLPRNLALKTTSEIQLEIRGPEPIGSSAVLIDGVPETAEAIGLPIELDGATTAPQRGRYRIRPLARGDLQLDRLTLRAESPYRLWRFTASLGEPETLRVFPNFAATARFDELVSRARTRDAGIRKRRRRGEGLEFHQLREYRPGDSIRQIDWKATSRKRELISREYEDERDQRIIFLLDCSRRMRAKDGEISHFDHSLNAMILLAHVARKGGDAVGFMSFGDEIRWVPPSKGNEGASRLLHSAYDLEPSTLGVDFRGAAEELSRRQRRRALVIVLTQLRPEDAQDFLPAMRLLRRKHFVLPVDLRPVEFDRVLASDPVDREAAFRAMGVWKSEIDRRGTHDRLRVEGVNPLDVNPSQLGPALVSRYFEIKQGGSL